MFTLLFAVLQFIGLEKNTSAAGQEDRTNSFLVSKAKKFKRMYFDHLGYLLYTRSTSEEATL